MKGFKRYTCSLFRSYGMPGGTRASFASKPFTVSEKEKLYRKLNIPKENILTKVEDVRQWRTSCTSNSIGLVPTMGCLQEGHISLISKARQENDVVVASIFVNPAQFAPHEDYNRYPWQPVKDIEQMITEGVDKVFIPDVTQMYPFNIPGQTGKAVSSTLVEPVGIDFLSEGQSRPGFFTGVCTVVAKLFNLIQPHHAYFGQKDGLQVMAIRRMVRDLNFPVQVISSDTIREKDGLAKSSRNSYLTATQRELAPLLHRSLLAAQEELLRGNRSYKALVAVGRKVLDHEMFSVEYFSICDSLTGLELDDCDEISGSDIMISAAIKFANCRLIDNIIVNNK